MTAEEVIARALCNASEEDWNAPDFCHTGNGEEPEEMREGYFFKARAALRALEEAGYRVVPVEATEAMVDAHFEAHAKAKTVFADVSDIWRAMLDAAGVQPNAVGPE